MERISVALAQAACPACAVTATPKLLQQLGHGADIGQARDIGQGQGIGRQQGRRHQFEGGILGAADGDFPRQAAVRRLFLSGPWPRHGGRPRVMARGFWRRAGCHAGLGPEVGPLARQAGPGFAGDFGGFWRRPACAAGFAPGADWRGGPRPAFRGGFWPWKFPVFKAARRLSFAESLRYSSRPWRAVCFAALRVRALGSGNTTVAAVA